jgi:sugar phosphate isomerase/epimerase
MLRRTFLRQGLGTLAAVGSTGILSSCQSQSAKTAGRSPSQTRLGFTTYTWGKPWDIPTLIANCNQVGIYGVELRTSQNYAHGVELEIGVRQRQEVKKRFQDSPVALVGMACGERYDSPDPEKLKAAIEKTKGYLKLSHDVGGSGLRVFPNDYHEGVPREKTVAQIATALNEVGTFAADYGQQVRLEAHGSAGELTSIRAIMDQVTCPQVRVKLNSSARDNDGMGFEHNFNLLKDVLGDTLHLHDLHDKEFPYQLQMDLLVKMGWSGWQLLEVSHKVPDPVAALDELRQIWEGMRDQAT